jgi:hypothetical protein
MKFLQTSITQAADDHDSNPYSSICSSNPSRNAAVVTAGEKGKGYGSSTKFSNSTVYSFSIPTAHLDQISD